MQWLSGEVVLVISYVLVQVYLIVKINAPDFFYLHQQFKQMDFVISPDYNKDRGINTSDCLRDNYIILFIGYVCRFKKSTVYMFIIFSDNSNVIHILW